MNTDYRRRRRAQARRRFSLPNFCVRTARIRRQRDTERWLTLQCIAGYTHPTVSPLRAGVPKGLPVRGVTASEFDLEPDGGLSHD
jgi:hypothetical protein